MPRPLDPNDLEDYAKRADPATVEPSILSLHLLLLDGWTTPDANGTTCFKPGGGDTGIGKAWSTEAVVVFADSTFNFVGFRPPHYGAETLYPLITRVLKRSSPGGMRVNFDLWEATIRQLPHAQHAHSTAFGILNTHPSDVCALARAFAVAYRELYVPRWN